MSEAGKKPGKRNLIIALLAVVAVAIVAGAAIWAMQPNGPGTGNNGTIETSVSEMIIEDSDLPSGWTVASPYYPGYQGTLPGEYREAGGVGLNFTSDDEMMYLIVLVVRCDNITQGQSLWLGVKSTFNTTKPGEWHSLEYADGALATNLTGTGSGHQGKYLWFIESNVLCGMVFTFTDGSDRTDQQLLGIADAQLAKIK